MRKKVEERAATGLCLLCDDEATRLGLCDKHYGRFRAVLVTKAPSEREAYKARLRREGKLLESRQGKRLDQINEFEQAGR